ncbi:inositol monophosphatase family protein [Peribacillus simplex]|uniref:inositol monophosphatase family protein n=1 Tax=Peribacillus simplex TaxID=1478 RepID=UPI003D2BF38F
MTSIDIHFCEELIKHVGVRLYEMSKREKSSSEDLFNQLKEHEDWATKKLKVTLTKKYPNIHWFISPFETELLHKVEIQGEYWVCNVTFGSIQFLQGIPSYAINLCLIRDGQPVLSFVYDPSQQELFYAIAGEGAFLNGKQIQVTQTVKLKDAIISTTSPSYLGKNTELTNLTLRGMALIIPQAFSFKILGSAPLQLAYIACGRLDGYWEFGVNFYNWVAGALLVQEAGGVVSNVQVETFTESVSGIIAANSDMHQEIEKEIQIIQ